MTSRPRKKQVALALTLIAALALTACGRRGAPLTPYESQVEQAKKNETPAPAKPVENRPFILDGLLQ